MTDQKLGWTEAVVATTGTLRVPLTNPPADSEWCRTFESVAGRRQGETRGQTWNDIAIGSDSPNRPSHILVDGVLSGTDSQHLRGYLDDLVEAANTEAARLRAESARSEADAARADAEREATAKRLTDEFRRP